MSSSDKRRKQGTRQQANAARAATAPSVSAHAQRTPTAQPAGKHPIPRFFALFIVCLAAFYAGANTSLFAECVFPAYLRLNAIASAGMLATLGEDVGAQGNIVVSPRFSLEVRRRCDAVEPSAVFVAAVLASPSSGDADYLAP